MIRHEFQAEIYSTQQRLNRLQSDVTDALATVQLDTSNTYVLNSQQLVRGKLALVVQCAFFSQQDGESIMDTCIARAQTAQAQVPSYIWLGTVDDVAGTVQRRRAAATAWTVELTTET